MPKDILELLAKFSITVHDYATHSFLMVIKWQHYIFSISKDKNINKR